MNKENPVVFSEINLGTGCNNWTVSYDGEMISVQDSTYQYIEVNAKLLALLLRMLELSQYEQIEEDF